MEPGEICCVYRVSYNEKLIVEKASKKMYPFDLETWQMSEHEGETVYIGSTITFFDRWYRHGNPKFNGHGPFGEWLHRDNNILRINVEILETIKEWNGTRDDLKKEIRRREFLWKQKFPARFGKYDGLFMQPKEVRLAHRRNIDKLCRDRNPEITKARNKINHRKSYMIKKAKRLKKKAHKELIRFHRLRQKLIKSTSTISFTSKMMSLLPKPKGKPRGMHARKIKLKT